MPEIKSLGISESNLIRKNVASNLGNVCHKIGKEVFSHSVYPLLEHLCYDSDEDVRISCVEQVPEIAMEHPTLFKKQDLEELYLSFLTDAKEEIR